MRASLLRPEYAHRARIALGLIAAIGIFSEISHAEVRIEEKTQVDRTRFSVAPEYVNVPSPIAGKAALNGVGFNAAIQYGLSRSWGLGAGVRQAFTSSADAMFTEFDLRLTFAITGSLILKKRGATLEGQNVYDFEERNRGGLRAQLVTAEYLFNTSTQVVPYSGIGFSTYYELPSNSSWNIIAGARLDLVSNGKQSISPVQIFGGVAFWF